MSRSAGLGDSHNAAKGDASSSNSAAAKDTRRLTDTEIDPKAPMSKSLEGKTVLSSGASGDAAYPKRFGHYEIQKELGRGGMATVYLAIDTKLERKVALKVPHKTVSADPEYMARFLREARSAATLFHPNICPVYEVGEIGGTPYLTMAFIEGKSLTDFIAEEHPIPPKRIANIVRKIATAMDVAHKQGIVHRDLKPSNIMIDARKEPMIMDFGLARRDDSKEDSRLTQDGLLIGTPIYMAPEVAKQGAGASGSITDVYSLGAILYELLAGRPPYKGTVNAVLVQVMRGQPKPPSTYRSELDPTIESICLRAMAKNSDERYQTMAEFAAALREYVQNPESAVISAVEVVEEVAPPAPVVESVRTPTERRPAAERSGTSASRSGSHVRPKVSPRSTKSNTDTLKLVLGLVAGCVVAIVIIVAVLVALKNRPSETNQGGGSSQTQAQPAPPAPTDQPPTPQPPPPPQIDIDSLPMVGTDGISSDIKEARIASNFPADHLRIIFPEIQANDGWYRYWIWKLKINGVEPPGGSGNSREEWPADVVKKPIQAVRPDYRILRSWFAEHLVEGKTIDINLELTVIYPPKGIETKRARIKLHVVKPEG